MLETDAVLEVARKHFVGKRFPHRDWKWASFQIEDVVLTSSGRVLPNGRVPLDFEFVGVLHVRIASSERLVGWNFNYSSQEVSLRFLPRRYFPYTDGEDILQPVPDPRDSRPLTEGRSINMQIPHSMVLDFFDNSPSEVEKFAEFGTPKVVINRVNAEYI